MDNIYTICFVAGARPNFMKIAPIINSFQLKINQPIYNRSTFKKLLVHTGQHYDKNMSEIFFCDLLISEPDFFLNIGPGSHAVQTAKIMIEFEKVLLKSQPDIVIVVGDVNSTIACSLTAKKLHIPIAHVESGLRSFDMSMPEEINRRLTDVLSDILFVTEQSGLSNLMSEGIPKNKIHFVGNVMIDTLLTTLKRIKKESFTPTRELYEFIKSNKTYAVLTLHRPSNVDDEEVLARIISALQQISLKIPIVFPIHPRTRAKLSKSILDRGNIKLINPVGFLDMLYAVKGSNMVLTDSGGLQEETTVLGIPCITIRENTERPSTIDIGTNYLVGTDPDIIILTAEKILKGHGKVGKVPPLWDGQTADRIVNVILEYLITR